MKHPRVFFDCVFAACLAVALVVVAGVLGSCAHPLPDLDKIPRGQFSRVVSIDGKTCQAWLPLVVRSDFGQVYVDLALAASQPWASEIGFAVAVPALPGERATLSIRFAACPDDLLDAANPLGCKHWAEAPEHCEGGVLIQEIRVYAPASVTELGKVLTHELGHALGVDDGADRFGHSADAASIMYHQIDVAKARVLPADGAALRKAWLAR